MDETHKLAAIVAPICWLLTILGAIILFFTLNKDIRQAWTISYILGTQLGLINLGFMVKGARHMLNEVNTYDGKPVKANLMYLFFRILVFTAIFSMVIVDQFIMNSDSPKFNVWSTLIGYVLVKVILITTMLIMKGKVKTN